MKKLLVLILAFGMVPIAAGQITANVYEDDGETPFDCNNNIMVGTELTIIVSSDSNDYWGGGLFIEGQDRAFGTLAGRYYDPNTRDYTGSHFEDAGDFAKVTSWKDSLIWGFDLYTFYPVDSNSDSNSTAPGNWFIVDYKADEIGDCNVGFYDYDANWDEPNYLITFSHVPTRDFNGDKIVNMLDYALFASYWRTTDCNEPTGVAVPIWISIAMLTITIWDSLSSIGRGGLQIRGELIMDQIVWTSQTSYIASLMLTIITKLQSMLTKASPYM